MGTYIIHFDDKPWEDLDDELYYRCFEIPWFSTTKTTISRLTPYTEDAAYAHGYTEAESKYREIRDELEKQAYQRGYETAKHECDDCSKQAYTDTLRMDVYRKGLSDAWEAARKICLEEDDGGIPASAINDIFNVRNYRYAVKDYSASDAIEKIRQYEQEKEEQIQVGDEIETPSGLKGYVVNFTDDELVHYVSSEGRFGTMGMSAVSKTGRHFPEIAEVLQKMKES